MNAAHAHLSCNGLMESFPAQPWCSRWKSLGRWVKHQVLMLCQAVCFSAYAGAKVCFVLDMEVWGEQGALGEYIEENETAVNSLVSCGWELQMSTEVLLKQRPSWLLLKMSWSVSNCSLASAQGFLLERGCETRAWERLWNQSTAQGSAASVPPNHIKDFEVLLLSEQVLLLQMIDWVKMALLTLLCLPTTLNEADQRVTIPLLTGSGKNWSLAQFFPCQ